VNIEREHRMVRGQGSGSSLAQAVDLVCAALPPRLWRLHRYLSVDTAGPTSYEPDGWERRDPRTVPAIRRPVGQARSILRHKSAALPVHGPDAAALTMDLRLRLPPVLRRFDGRLAIVTPI
jgi:hypothetical protein